ncbi:helix-turn-helix domain-containing protein [Arthrobacter glacialis]|uniref:DNA-binding protein n=1 Tax=Arthrobacter glacialis TaxID=1664 RepID=A0A2S3ZW34_ARTGL|nr:helix-turn-helix domain-containing protein [Arthrobacter glacialis]POH73471.1 DNA-binding protein [Arthrobacter glacialis]
MGTITSIAAPYVGVQDAAERTGLSVVTLRRYIRDGRLPAVKMRGRVFVTEADLDAAVEPRIIVPKTESLQDWAKRMAADAPPFRPEQVDLIMSAFATVLGGDRR